MSHADDVRPHTPGSTDESILNRAHAVAPDTVTVQPLPYRASLPIEEPLVAGTQEDERDDDGAAAATADGRDHNRSPSFHSNGSFFNISLQSTPQRGTKFASPTHCANAVAHEAASPDTPVGSPHHPCDRQQGLAAGNLQDHVYLYCDDKELQEAAEVENTPPRSANASVTEHRHLTACEEEGRHSTVDYPSRPHG
jgi:hypothetical protein